MSSYLAVCDGGGAGGAGHEGSVADEHVARQYGRLLAVQLLVHCVAEDITTITSAYFIERI